MTHDEYDKIADTRFKKAYPAQFAHVRAGISLPPGWFDIFEDTCKMIIMKYPEEWKLLRFSQIKEKFGQLRIYFTLLNDPIIQKDTYSLIEQMFYDVECKSEFVCQICGKEGKKQNAGCWITTRCNQHTGVPLFE